jgi:DNA-binding LacI/PurR family transcriptional regulator
MPDAVPSGTSPSADPYTDAAHRPPTLLEVAKLAGVSRATASLVIRNAAGPSASSRERVQRAAAELGYRPDRNAQLLRSRQSRLLGVLFRAQDPFHADLIETIYATAEGFGYDVVLSAVFPSRTEERAFEALSASRCQAVIALGASEACKTDFGSRLPIVEIGRPPEETAFDAIYTDDEYGVRLAVDHLISLGHTEIVHLDGGHAPGAAERQAGYLHAMEQHRLSDHIRVLPGDYTEISGAQAARQLLTETTLPTAVVAGNDQSAVGLLDELRSNSLRVPNDISIIGYDDSRLAKLAHVDLTTVRQDVELLAKHAVEASIERAADNGVTGSARVFKLAHHLIVRSSTGPALR